MGDIYVPGYNTLVTLTTYYDYVYVYTCLYMNKTPCETCFLLGQQNISARKRKRKRKKKKATKDHDHDAHTKSLKRPFFILYVLLPVEKQGRATQGVKFFFFGKAHRRTGRQSLFRSTKKPPGKLKPFETTSTRLA